MSMFGQIRAKAREKAATTGGIVIDAADELTPMTRKHPIEGLVMGDARGHHGGT